MQQIFFIFRSGRKIWEFPVVPNGTIPMDMAMKSKNSNGNGRRGLNTLIPSSGIYCHVCHLVVALGDYDDGEFIYDKKTGKPIKGWHNRCVKQKESAIVQGESMESCRMVNS